MDISAYTLEAVLYIFGLEIKPRLVGIRYDKKIQTEREHGDKQGGKYIRYHHSVETDTTGEDGHNLRVSRHLGGKENHRNEDEQRTEHIHEVWHKIEVIVEDNRPERSFLADKIINLLTDVEDDDNTDDQQ